MSAVPDEALPAGRCYPCNSCSAVLPRLLLSNQEGRTVLPPFSFVPISGRFGERVETAGGAGPRAEESKGRPELLASARQAHYPPAAVLSA